jgi:hypothetical protein
VEGDGRMGVLVVAGIVAAIGSGMVYGVLSAPKASRGESPATRRGSAQLASASQSREPDEMAPACGSPLSVISALDDNTLAELAQCRKLSSKLSITQPSTQGLQSLRKVEGLLIHDEGASDLSGLSGLKVIGGTGVVIGPPTKLQNLRGLESVTRIIGGLWIDDTDHLVTLDGLQGVWEVGNEIRLEDNSELRDISALANLRPIHLTKTERKSLVAFNGRRARRLSEVGELSYIRIINNPQLPEEHVQALAAKWKVWFKGTIESCGNKGGSPCESPQGKWQTVSLDYEDFPLYPEDDL